ncbi:MAG: cell division protein FtsZ [Sphingomonadales bacterium BRH_c42]|nr:MAG: cell division protein FtsZ [Sphingomonadales bacterium BRH_c42]
MSINIGPASKEDLRPRITVIGVGGAGGNAIANMIAAEIEGVDFIVANTDAQALSLSATEKRIQLGPHITGGLGAGARPEVGRAAAEETVSDIEDALEGVNMVFIAAGMGGGTGTGAASVIAEAARRKGVLTVGVVTKPFMFEGARRMRAAESGIQELQNHVDTLIVIPNQNLFLVAKPETTFKEAFQLADEVLQQGVRSITDLMVMPGLINLDFADVRSVMSEMGKAMMGTGEGEGENRALEAAQRAIANPLLDGVSMQGAKGVIISIIGGEDMKLLEVDEAANHIRELVDEDANIIWGSAFNPDLQGRIRVSVVATGIEQGAVLHASEPAPFSLGSTRPPKRPVLELSTDETQGDPFEMSSDDQFDEMPTYGRRGDSEPLLDVPEEEESIEPEPTGAAFPSDAGEPFDLSGMQAFEDDADYSEEESDEGDGIVDPLAGLRNEEGEYVGGASGMGGQTGFGQREADEYGEPEDEDEPFDLSSDMTEEPSSPSDEGASGSSGEYVAPVPGEGRRRQILGGGGSGGGSGGSSGAGGSGAPVGGNTLFERMASLSRGGGASEEHDEEEDDNDGDEGGSSLSIPRFLGRQNNQ